MTSFAKLTRGARLSLAALVAGAAALVGLIVVAIVHGGRVTPGVVFLTLGWLALCLVLWFFVRAWVAVATPIENEGFAHRLDRKEELEIEKRSLLKAIKEIEFDRETGKMSQADADDIIRFYRTRAIEILKEVDQIESGKKSETPRDEIERDLAARMVVAGLTKTEDNP